MASSTVTPGTFASESFTGSTDAWSNPSNAGASDNAYASAATTTIGDVSEYLKATNCGFAIPSNAAIVGITVSVEWNGKPDGVFASTGRQHRCRIIKGGTISSDTTFDASTTLPTSDTVTTIGTTTSLWGTTWTPDDINASTFGVAVAVKAASSGSPSSINIDRVQITVYYQPTTGLVTETEAPVAGSVVTASGADVDIVYGVAFTPGQGPTELQSMLRGITVRRGRNKATDRVEAGTCVARVVDTTGSVDPSNASGANYGSILPLRQVYAYRRVSDVTYWLHRGRVERYQLEWVPPSVQFNGIESADAFELLATQIIVGDYASLTTTLTGSNNDLVYTAREAGEEGERITVAYVVAGTNTALDTGVTDPLAGNAVIRAEVTPAYWKGQQRWTPGSGPSQQSAPVTVSVSGGDIVVTVATNGGGAATSTAAQIKTALEANTDVMKLVSVAYSGADDGTGVVTAMAATALSGGSWAQELSGARINRVLDLVGWPDGQRDIDTGLYEVCARGFGLRDNVSGLAHILDCAESETGYCFVTGAGIFTYHDGEHRSVATRSTVSQATFVDADSGAGIPYISIKPTLDKERIINEVTVTGGLSTSIPQTVTDTTSQGVYDRRFISRSTQLASDTDALAVANALLTSFADPQTTFDEITLVQTDDVAGWDDAVFGLEIGDLVTLGTNPPAHDTNVSYQAFVEAIELTGALDMPWVAKLQLSSASSSSTPGGGGGGGGAGALYDSSGDELVLDSGTAGILG